jgi:DNA-binding CsgD family transcriptional regulator
LIVPNPTAADAYTLAWEGKESMVPQVDWLPVGLLVTDVGPDLRCRFVNEFLRRRMKLQKVVGRPLAEVWGEAEGRRVIAVLRQVIASGEARHLRDFEVFPLADDEGRLSYLIVVIVHIAERVPARSRLTLREWQIAHLVAEGLSNLEIAQRIHRSPATVASHVGSVLQKLEFGSRAQIVAWVIRQQLSGKQD